MRRPARDPAGAASTGAGAADIQPRPIAAIANTGATPSTPNCASRRSPATPAGTCAHAVCV